MALAALDTERAIERTATADLDHVAKCVLARGLADDAMIEALAFFIRPAQELFRAIDGRAFLVASDEKTNRAFVRSMPGGIGASGGGEGGDSALHVGRAAPPDRAIGQFRRERIEAPASGIPHGDHIGMPRKDEVRRPCTDAGIEIGDVRRARFRERQPLRRKARLVQREREDVERAAVVRRHRAAAHQRAAKVESEVLHRDFGFPGGFEQRFIAWAGRKPKFPRKFCRQICFKEMDWIARTAEGRAMHTPGLDFALGPDLDMLRDTVRSFASAKIAPRAAEIDRADAFPADLWPPMGALGLHGITVEETYGGTGLGYLAHCIAMEEISRASASVGLSYGAHSNLCVNQIHRNGTEDQKRRYLPKLLSGERGRRARHVGGQFGFRRRVDAPARRQESWPLHLEWHQDVDHQRLACLDA